jgi:hypothetical protein
LCPKMVESAAEIAKDMIFDEWFLH